MSLIGQIRIVMGDPSGTLKPFDLLSDNITNDPFGIVGIQADLIQKKIHVKLARQLKNTKFSSVANEFHSIKDRIKPHFMGLETNNRGKEVLKLFKTKYHLSLHGVSTSSNLTDQTRENGYAMDKPFMINWFAEQKQDHNILFPEKPTHDMSELITQVSEISRFKSLNGSESYKRIRGRHDDLFMALLLCCHIALLYMKRHDSLK